MFGRLAAELERDRDQVLAGVLHDQPAGRRLAGEGDLGDARAARRAACRPPAPKPLTMLSTPGGSRSPISSIQTRIDAGVCSAGLSTTQLPAASAGASFQHGHQQREVPRDDLADDAERLVEVVGDGVVVDLGDPALLGADRAGEVAEVVDGQRKVGGQWSRGSACRCPRSRRRRASRGSPPSGRRCGCRTSARSAGAGAAPGVLRGVRGVERELDVRRVRAGDLAETAGR